MTRFLSHHPLGARHSRSSHPTARGLLPGCRLPREGVWDDALWSLCLLQAPASGAALAGTAAATAWAGEREKGGGLERLGKREEGRWGGKERRGGNLSALRCLPLVSLRLAVTPGSLSTPARSRSPPSPPTLPPERAGGEPQPARGGGAGEAKAVGVCVCVKDATSLSILLSQAAGGGAASSGSGGGSGGGFRSPAAKMLKVTVPSCSSSSCSSVTASAAPGAGGVVLDYWIDGSNRDALSNFFEVESELGR